MFSDFRLFYLHLFWAWITFRFSPNSDSFRTDLYHTWFLTIFIITYNLTSITIFKDSVSCSESQLGSMLFIFSLLENSISNSLYQLVPFIHRVQHLWQQARSIVNMEKRRKKIHQSTLKSIECWDKKRKQNFDCMLSIFLWAGLTHTHKCLNQ